MNKRWCRGLSLLLAVNENTDLIPVAFDSGGVTTGPITVPFIMALGVGISGVLGDKQLGPTEDSMRGGREGLGNDRTNIW